jgi:hypothetical protein
MGYNRYQVDIPLTNFSSVEETVRIHDLLDARRKDLELLLAEWEEVAQAIDVNK